MRNMNDTGRAQDPASSPSASSPFEERDLRRSNEGRMLTGVCAGLGRYARIDPVVLRVGFAVLVLGSGIGIMLYIAAFLLMRETDGGPGYLEQWIRRDFDGETVLTLLAGLFALGLIVNVSSDGVGTGTIVVGTVLAIALLAAHSRGVDLLAVARSLPDRLRRHRAPSPAPADRWPGSPAQAPGAPAGQRPVGGRDPVTQAAASPAGRPGAETVSEPYAPAAGPASATVAEPHAGAAGPGSATAPPPAPGTRPAPAFEDRAGQAPGMPPGPARPPEHGPWDTPPGPYGAARPLFDSSGEPFSPYGPYQPLDPRRRQQHYSPYDPSAYLGTVVAPPRPRRRGSLVGSITIFLAIIVGGIIVAIQSASGSVNMTVAGGAVLVVIGAGLLVATWFGRGAGLVATGTVLSLALIAGSTLGGVPKKFGDYTWRPTALSEVARTYSVDVGEGSLDLGDLVLPPGSRTVVNASVSVGEIRVILPPTARAEVNGSTRFGDVKIDHAVEGGADIQHNKILEPEVLPEGDVATIVLNIKAGLGDVEVRRAA